MNDPPASRKCRTRLGFTLIELMLVVAIIGLLAAIAVPKFAGLVIKAKEASIKGKLGALRSAISIYYTDNESDYPADPNSDLPPKYLDEVPFAGHPMISPHRYSNDCAFSGAGWDNFWTTRGQSWMYFPLTGRVYVNCTHTDSKGTTWSQW